MAIYDTIIWLRSLSTGKCFPSVQFTADTDMATCGWISLTSVERPEIIVTQLTGNEFRAAGSESPSYTEVEGRVNAILGRNDLRVPWLASAEPDERHAAPDSFPGFLKTHRPVRLLYRDIFDPDSVAEEVSTQSREQFEHDGGVVTRL